VYAVGCSNFNAIPLFRNSATVIWLKSTKATIGAEVMFTLKNKMAMKKTVIGTNSKKI
jgi:hypothetical protein